MKKLFTIISFILITLPMFSQNNQENHNIESIDYQQLQLPPLEVLYENAQKTPTIEIYETQKKIQERLLKKEKRGWLNFFSVKGGYTYGKTDNYGAVSDVNSPIIYEYRGLAQNYYNVGGNISIPLESLFDIKGKVKRQKLAIEVADLQKEKAFSELKREIATLYAKAVTLISSIKMASEAISVAQGAYVYREKDFQSGGKDIEQLLFLKRQQMELNNEYENLRSEFISTIYSLEIITNTPIISAIEN